jgi:hypothetical protein
MRIMRKKSVTAQGAANRFGKNATAAEELRPGKDQVCWTGHISIVPIVVWAFLTLMKHQGTSRRKQYDLHQLALEYLAEMPFERASELFEKSTGVSFSDHILHDLFEEFSESLFLDDVIPTSEEIERRIDSLSTSGNRRPIMVAATDGAHMPTRPHAKRNEKRGPGEYKEAKGFRLYALGKDDMVQIASWHQIQDADQCAIDLKKVAQRIPTDKVRIALIGDGAPWLWRCMKEAFPAGREILDFYHCAEHIHDLAKVQFEDNSFKALLWVESTMARLFHHEVG